MNKQKMKQQMHAILVLQKRMSQTRFWGVGIFLVMSISFIIASVLLINQLNYTQTNTILLEKEIMLIPLIINAILIALYLSFSSMVQIAREYEQGTYELLLYGPMDEKTFLLGYFISQIKIFLICLLATILWTLICIRQLNLALQPELFLIFLLSLLMTTQLISFGILFASISRNTRTSVIYFSLTMLFLAGIALADTIISRLVTITVSTANDPLLIVRDVLATINSIIQWVSPFSLMVNAINAALDQVWSIFTFNSVLILIEIILLLSISIWTIRRKGVRAA